MNDNDQNHFNRLYEQHLNALTLQSKSERTIEAYSRSLRKLAAKFDMPPDRITTEHLKHYFLELAQSHSWNSVKIDRNAFQFFFKFVLNKQWDWFQIVPPPKVKPLQSVLAIQELSKIINATQKLSYQTYFLTVYSLGLRLSEGLNLNISDIDSTLMRVHLRRCKNMKDRFVPLPHETLLALRRYWSTHRHPTLLFLGGKPPKFRKNKYGEWMFQDKGGLQKAITIVAKECGILKNVHIHTLRH